jgi:hypothetical protein
MSNQVELTKAVADMFLAFPAASKTSADQIRVYVQELSGWPASVVSRAIKAARDDPERNRAFPPSVDEIQAKVRSTGMTAPERQLLASLQGRNIVRLGA